MDGHRPSGSSLSLPEDPSSEISSSENASPVGLSTSRRGERLRPEHEIARSADFVACYRRGRKRHGSLVTLHVHPTRSRSSRASGSADARLGITASRKVGKAVVRHRLKRRIREIFRRWPRRWDLDALDIVVHLKPAAAGASFRDLESEIERLLATLLRESSLRDTPLRESSNGASR